MAKATSSRLNSQISAEAAEWLVELRSGDMDMDMSARHAFNAWLRASPENLRAFIEMSMLWNYAARVDAQRRIVIEDLLAKHPADNIIELDRPSELEGMPQAVSEGESFADDISGKRQRWFSKVPLAAGILVGMAGIALFSWSLLNGSPTYVTAVGEQRSIGLADGSTVMLNARSRLRVRFTSATRTVELLEGQAFFHVAKNRARPFVVLSTDTAIRAVGTQFDVNRSHGATTVTVLEGRVAVYPEHLDKEYGRDIAQFSTDECSGLNRNCGQTESRNAGSALLGHAIGDGNLVLLSADEQVQVADGQRSMQTVHVDAGSATGWRQGRIMFESATLAEVAEEFNRYSVRKFMTEDHGASPLRLSGVFATDPDFLIQYLHELPDVTVHESEGAVYIVRNAEQ